MSALSQVRLPGGLQGIEQVLLHFTVDIFKGEAGAVPGCCIFKIKFTVFVPDKRNSSQYFAPGLMVTLARSHQMQI